MVEHLGLVVHHDVRLAVEAAGRECAALLSLVRVAIAPAVVQAGLEHAAIFAPQRLQRPHDHLDRMVPGAAGFQLAEDRDVSIVVMNVRQLHLPAAKLEIAIQRRQVLVDRGDQVVVNADAAHCRETARAPASFDSRAPWRSTRRAGSSRKASRPGVFVSLVLGVILMKCRFADGSLRRIEECRKRGVAELDRFALFVFHEAEFQIGVGQLAEGMVGGFRHLGLHGQEFFFRLAERVRLVAEQPFDGRPMRGQLLGGQEFLHRRRWNRHDFRADDSWQPRRPGWRRFDSGRSSADRCCWP